MGKKKQGKRGRGGGRGRHLVCPCGKPLRPGKLECKRCGRRLVMTGPARPAAGKAAGAAPRGTSATVTPITAARGRPCPCGRANKSTANFCTSCGVRLAPAAVLAEPDPGRREQLWAQAMGERGGAAAVLAKSMGYPSPRAAWVATVGDPVLGPVFREAAHPHNGPGGAA